MSAYTLYIDLSLYFSCYNGTFNPKTELCVKASAMAATATDVA